ncbi:GNAT family N-acetyltransferase [Chloroflexia bacterium SDU3-3]|nr:GNAT family N-acetyltransferase [Chloroflexia bacterium SDU3-3]
MDQKLHFPDAVPVLLGDAVYLRELAEEDIPAWFARATDAESAELAGDPIPESIDLGTQWLEHHRERFDQREALRWAIVPNGSVASVGTVGLSITSAEARVAMLGIVIGRASWGRGIGTDAARTAIGYAFGTLGLAEVQAEVLVRNTASRRMLEKAGLRILRSLPGDPNSATDFEDCLLYGISRQDDASS